MTTRRSGDRSRAEEEEKKAQERKERQERREQQAQEREEEQQRRDQRKQQRQQEKLGIRPAPPPYEAPETALERLGPGFGYLAAVIGGAFLLNLVVLVVIAGNAGG